MELSKAFGQVLRDLRKEADLTQEELGLEADLRRTFVSVLELGQQQPTLQTIFKLSSAIKISGRFLSTAEGKLAGIIVCKS